MKLALVVTVTVVVVVEGAAVTVKEQAAALEALVNRVVGVVVVDVDDVGELADAGTVSAEPETASTTELPVVDAMTVGRVTPEREEVSERVVTAEAFATVADF